MPGFILELDEAAESMAPNDSAEPDSALPDILDCCRCLISASCRYCGNRQSPRSQMLSYYSSPLVDGNESKPEHWKPQGPHSLSQVSRDSQRVEDLKLTLKAITKLRDRETKTKATNRVNEWREEQMNLMNAERDNQKTTEEKKRWASTDSKRETMQELLKLHNAERDKWKSERDKWKVERESWKLTYKRLKEWKLTCMRLQDEAYAREQQLRKLTVESQQLKAEVIRLEFTRLASADAEEKQLAQVFRNLLEQLHLEQHTLDLQSRKVDKQMVSNHQAPTRKLERPSDSMCEHSTQSESDVRKGIYSTPEVEDWVTQQQAMELSFKRHRWEAQSAKLGTAVSDGKNLEEVCRDLRDQLEQRNAQIKCYKVGLQKASKQHYLAQQQIREHRKEINKLKTNEVAECIICTNEFGDDPDQQRAYWKNCNHANICYNCTKTLWSLNNRQCPTCKTPASCMPTRLPPKIYL